MYVPVYVDLRVDKANYPKSEHAMFCLEFCYSCIVFMVYISDADHVFSSNSPEGEC